MNLKKIGLITLLAASSLLSACSGCANRKNKTEPINTDDIPEGYIRVFFYEDFTQPDTGECLSHVDVLPESTIKAPATPHPVYEEFSVFLGWSYKEVIKDEGDLWNFATDKVVVPEGANTFGIYAVWDAE